MLPRFLAGAGTVTASGISGLEAGSYIGGILAAAIAGIALYFTIAAANRAKRKEYRDEITAAEQRGAAAAFGSKEFQDALAAARREGNAATRQAMEARLRNLLDEVQETRDERDFYREKYFDVGGRQLPPPRRNTDEDPETD